MSNFDYHTDYLPLSKLQFKTNLVRLRLKRFVLTAIVISVGVFFFKSFISNPIPDIKTRNPQSLNLTHSKIVRTIDQNESKNTTISDTRDQPILEKTNPIEQNREEIIPEKTRNQLDIVSIMNDNNTTISHISKNPIDSTTEETDKKKGTLKAAYKVNYNATETQNDQIITIIKHIAVDKAIPSSREVNPKISTKNKKKITIENRLKIKPIISDSEKSLTKFSDTKPQKAIDTKDIQKMYQKDLDRLFNEMK